MVRTCRLAAASVIISTLSIISPLHAWDIIPTTLSGVESQIVDFDIVIGEDEWSPAGTVCNDAVWDFEFQLDGSLVDGTAEWGIDLSSPFAGGMLTAICSDAEEEVIARYTISLIEDFIPEDNEEAEIFFEHCEEAGEGALVCTDETLTVEIVEVAGGGLPEVGLIKIKDAAEPITDGQFSVALEAPAPDGGLEVGMFISGTATAGADYVALSTLVFFPEGTSQVLVDVEVLNDGIMEDTEFVMVTLLEDPSYNVTFQLERVIILIADDDGAGDGLTINQGISDAWFNSATPGQGFFIIVFPTIGKIFFAWFTYDTQRPPANVQAILGDPGARWLTALGDYSGNTAELVIEFTEGGVFNMVPPDTTQTNDGTIVLEFLDCTTGMVHYNIPSLGLSGTVPIERLTLDNVGLCEAQNEDL